MSIRLMITPGAKQIMEAVGLSADRAVEALHKRDSGTMALTKPMRLHAFRWFDDGQIVFIDGLATKTYPDEGAVRVSEVTANVILALRENLPAGKLNPLVQTERLVSVVVNSFGLPVTCDDRRPRATMYDGPWDGKAPRVSRSEGDKTIHTCGTFDQANKLCDRVWALSMEKYLNWWKEGQS